MYIPQSFHFKHESDKIAFMKQHHFATLINVKNGLPMATHLPFVVDDPEGKLLLSSHLAMANEQAQYLESGTTLVIFSEPHAYIAPAHYNKHESVPTWNYVAVHAYGQASIIQDDLSKLRVLEQMITCFDRAYQAQWNSLSDRFKHGMLQGIVAFEITVSLLQGQEKLSQNKTVAERERIIQHLQHGNEQAERKLAECMRKNLE